MNNFSSIKNFDYHGKNVLKLLRNLLRKSEFQNKKNRILEGITKKEVVTKADMATENVVIKYIQDNNIPVNLDGEEKRRSVLTSNPKGLWTLDPIDGTYNYFRGIFPYVSILSIFDFPNPKNLGSAVWAGMINHENGEIITINSPTLTSKRKTLEGKTNDIEASVIIDLGSNQKLDAYKPYEKIIANSWWRNISCAGLHFFGIASGGFDAYLSPIQKPEELVAGIPLIEKAGGAVITYDGKRAGDLPYDFNKKYQIIAAATPELAKEIKNLLNY